MRWGKEELIIKVVGIGNPVFDIIIHTSQIPGHDESSSLIKKSFQGGGKVATALVTLGRMGVETGYIGVVGEGPYGKFCCQDFSRHLVDTSKIVVDKGSENSVCVVISEKETMSRSFIGNRGTHRELKISDLDQEYISAADYLHLENLNHVSRKAAGWAKKADMTVVIDADHYQENIDNNLELIDIFIGSEFYYKNKFSDKNYHKNCQQMQKEGPQLVIFTLGEKGCVGIYKQNYFEIPAFEVEVADTTGAGDVFHGAFIYGLMQDWEVKRVAKFASAVSAIKCTRVGGRAGIPDRKTVDKFIQNGEIDYTEIDERVKFYEQGLFSYDLF